MSLSTGLRFRCRTHGDVHLRQYSIGSAELEYYACPQCHDSRAPVSAGKVKALEWGYSVTTYLDRETGKELPAAEFWQADTILVRGRYTIMRLVDARVKRDRESYRLDVGREDQKFPSLDAAKAAAQADYEARILSALQPGDGWQGIESAPGDVDVWVAYDCGTVERIVSEDNDGDWRPYDGVREQGVSKPAFWMHAHTPAPPSALSQEGGE